MEYIIYSIYNKISKKYYIGSTRIDLWYNRKHSHLSGLRRNKHHSFKLQYSYNKHGINAFEFNIIEKEIYSLEKRIEKETFYIKKFKCFKFGYNCTESATMSGMKVSKKSRIKMSKTRKLGFKNGTMTQPNSKGVKRDPIMMKKINDMKKIPIIQYDLNMNFIKEWDSSADATRSLKFARNCIINCLRKGIKYSSMGYKWKYKNCEDIV